MLYYPIQKIISRGTSALDWRERYQVLATIQETFKGVLFLACDQQTGQKVVCRVLYNTSAEYYQVLKQIVNPHFPRIYQVIRDQKDIVIIEEYIQGETLEHWLSRGNPFSLEDIVCILSQLCEALETIHIRGIIHRDIKPSNLILCGRKVVLIDFDAARIHRSSTSKDTVYMGTEGYAAPEQYGFAQTDSRSDIYSLGVVLRELCGNDPRHPLAPIIQRCTAFDPANRYRSTREILNELQRMNLLRPAGAAGRPAPARRQSYSNHPQQAAGISPPPTAWKTVLKIVLGVVFGMQAIVILIPQAHEVTVLDYILSKLVYLQFILFPAVLLLNLFHIWQKLPLLRSSKKPCQAVGIILYCLSFLVVLILLNSIANALYSPEAQEILKIANTAQ